MAVEGEHEDGHEHEARPPAAIRPVTAGDVPAVVELVAEVLAEFGLRFGCGATTDDELRDLPRSYEARRGAFWVVEAAAAETGGPRIVGTAGIAEVEPGVFELRKMYLRGEARGRGVGRALLGRAIAHARGAGARRVVLDTVDAMKGAIALYERAGFRRDDAQIRGARCSRGYALEL